MASNSRVVLKAVQGDIASMATEKSPPLHDFSLPKMSWNKDGNSSCHPKRRRSVKSPLRRRDPSSISPLPQSPLSEPVSAPSQRRGSPLRDSLSPSPLESANDLSKQSPGRAGVASKQSPDSGWVKHSPMSCDAVKKSPIRHSVSESRPLERNKSGFIEYRRNRLRNSASESVKNGVYALSSEKNVVKSEKRQEGTEGDASGTNKSKFWIKIPCKNKYQEHNAIEEPRKIDTDDKGDETDGAKGERKMNNNVNEETRIRSLRPRKPVGKCRNVNEAGRIGASGMPDKNKQQQLLKNDANRSVEIEGNSKDGGADDETKVNRKLSISIALSKLEIEEDIFSMTGSKPMRKPKKRAKNIQKQVDFVFPGMWLVSITPDSYKVSENYLKG